MINKLQRWWRNLVSFLRETRAELKKVVWPSWGEVRTLTAIVVLTMVGIGTILWGTDGLLSLLVGLALR
ncbi:MAG TPA: preprotein translocase subunit SecE [Firmicutes bacterium]|nr:preprotein translocase subunit SecE [Candidatus Fermentithermobacillaceae bacterium]